MSLPRPAQDPVPIVIGGHTAVAARRAGRLGDGFFPAKGDVPALCDTMRRAADEAGRDPDRIALTTGTPALMATVPSPRSSASPPWASAACISPPTFDPAAVGDALGQYGENVIPRC